jgi:hypothetical protein
MCFWHIVQVDVYLARPNERFVHPPGSSAGRCFSAQVDGVKNPKQTSVFFEDMPIHTASFAADGAYIVAAGRRKHFYVYDLGAGRVDRVAGEAMQGLHALLSVRPSACWLACLFCTEFRQLRWGECFASLGRPDRVPACTAFEDRNHALLEMGTLLMPATWGD